METRSLPAGGDRWAISFIAIAFAFQLGLFVFGGTAIRLPLRVGIYGVSVAMLVLFPGRAIGHPAARLAVYAIAILAIEMLNPGGDTLTSRVATVVLYTSVLAPLFWVARLRFGPAEFRWVLRIMWAFYTASATFGVLQVNYPGRFDGAMSANYDDASLLMHTFVLDDGQKIIRPKGLTDTPGGAAAGGVNAIILGCGLLLTETHLLMRAATVAGMVGGLFCIYICQGRTNLIVIGLATGAIGILLARRRAIAKLLILVSIAAAVVIVGTTVAFAVGGQSTVDRFATLVADDPGTVFQANRGQFLNALFGEDLQRFVFGAGQGRWGMVNSYFGSSTTSIWAEMLWQALLYDGGAALMIVYALLLISLLKNAWQLAVQEHSAAVGTWAAVVFGYNLAAAAASFVYPIFAVQIGMEVIFLNACLYTSCKYACKSPMPAAGGLPKGRFGAGQAMTRLSVGDIPI